MTPDPLSPPARPLRTGSLCTGYGGLDLPAGVAATHPGAGQAARRAGDDDTRAAA